MRKHSKLVILILVLISLWLRTWGTFSYLPYIIHPDEPQFVAIIQTIFKTGDLNPHYFMYPSMFFYVNVLAYIPYFLLGKLLGIFSNPNEILAPSSLVMGTSIAQTPSALMLGYWVTILFGVGSVILVFLIGRRLTNNFLVGLVAAMTMAVSPTNVALTRSIIPDPYMLFWSLVVLWVSVLILQEGKIQYYILAGLAIGFTAASKYNGALIFVCVLAAHFIRFGWRGFQDRKLYLAGFSSLIGFILISPFSILDHQSFLNGLAVDFQAYRTGHPGWEGDALIWYISYLWTTEGIVSLLAVLQIIRGLYQRSKETIVLSAFPILYLVFVSNFTIRNTQTISPVIGFLALLSSILLVDAFEGKVFRTRLPQGLVRTLAVALVFVSLAVPFWNTVQDSVKLATINSLTTARVWIDNNLPEGAKIMLEPYSPYINPGRFSIQGVWSMTDNLPEWYINNGFDYLVFSQAMFGRYYGEPAKYAHEIALYNTLFETFAPVRIFTDGGYEVRVYAIVR